MKFTFDNKNLLSIPVVYTTFVILLGAFINYLLSYSEQPLCAWYAETKNANWKSPAEIKTFYRGASILPGNRVVFNIKGNTYRLVVLVEYS
jgi:mRNA-degrading endonuclease HigB of HigAB toxin-antitoxin module